MIGPVGMISARVGVRVVSHEADTRGMYAGRVTRRTRDARWARGLAVAAVTAPGVLAAQLVTAHAAPSPRAVVVVSAVVALVACAVPTRSAHGTALLAALAQLAGHAVLAVTAPARQAGSGCLSVVGRGADLGVRYALAHDSSCPPGTLPAGPALAAVVGALVAAAVVLVGHAALATLTGALIAAAAAGLDVVRRLSAAVLPALAALAGLAGVRAVPETPPALPLPEPPVLRDRWHPGGLLLRGPPVPLPAPA
jgi:hypothetical protein